MNTRSRRMRLLSGLALAAITILAAIPGSATEEIADQQALDCLTCHPDDQDYAALSDQGMYFAALATLEGFEQVLDRFGECSYCHQQRAGSEEMTREGLRFQWMMEDMQGLAKWLEEVHPKPRPDDAPDSN